MCQTRSWNWRVYAWTRAKLVHIVLVDANISDPMTTERTLFERFGGLDGVRAIVDRFYDLMDARPDARELRDLHGADLMSAREKLFAFLCGWLGGPPLYVRQYGHPRLRARHLPFAIDARARDQWLLCMRAAFDESPALALDRQADTDAWTALARLADHMRNQPEAD